MRQRKGEGEKDEEVGERRKKERGKKKRQGKRTERGIVRAGERE